MNGIGPGLLGHPGGGAQGAGAQRIGLGVERQIGEVGEMGGRQPLALRGEEGAQSLEAADEEPVGPAAVAVASSKLWLTMVTSGWPGRAAWRSAASHLLGRDARRAGDGAGAAGMPPIWVTGISTTPPQSTGSISAGSSGSALGRDARLPLWLLS